MNRKGPWEGYRLRPLSPSRLPLRAKRETSGYEAGIVATKLSIINQKAEETSPASAISVMTVRLFTWRWGTPSR